MWEFHHIYNFGAGGHKDVLIRFEVKRSKVKVIAKQLWSDKQFGMHFLFFSLVCGMNK